MLVLRWRSFSERGSDRVAVFLPMKPANISVMHNSDQIVVSVPYVQNHR